MTDKMKIIEVKQSVFADNDADAEKLRKEYNAEIITVVAKDISFKSYVGTGKRKNNNACTDDKPS